MLSADILPLDPIFASWHAQTLATIASGIPGVPYNRLDIMAERKDGRLFHGKWDHSLVAILDGAPVGIALGYEREREDNDQYPHHTLYLSELAVAASHQHRGIGRDLLASFIEYGRETGMKWLPAELTFSVQTAQDTSNRHVINLYRGHRFTFRATKVYPNRTDVVMGRPA